MDTPNNTQNTLLNSDISAEKKTDQQEKDANQTQENTQAQPNTNVILDSIEEVSRERTNTIAK